MFLFQEPGLNNTVGKKKRIYMTNLVVQVFVVNRETCHESSLWKEFSN